MQHNIEPFLTMVKTEPYAVLDTETTGLNNAEICQIAIIANTGKILLDTLVQPTKSIPHQAWRIHGINDEAVERAPGWTEVSENVRDILDAYSNCVVYNAEFDVRMLHSSDEHIGVDSAIWRMLTRWWCAMNAYAEVYGVWSEYHQSYGWVKLGSAARQMNVTVSGAHSALGDCQTTLALVQAMAME